MLKKCLIAGTFIASLSVGGNAFAAEVETNTTITNITTLPTVESTAYGTLGTMTGTSHLECVAPLFSSPYAFATSKSSILADSIYAKVRVYDNHGGLKGSKSDTEKNSKYAGATYTDKSTKTPDFGMGNHTYAKKNYKTIIHETKAWF